MAAPYALTPPMAAIAITTEDPFTGLEVWAPPPRGAASLAAADVAAAGFDAADAADGFRSETMSGMVGLIRLISVWTATSSLAV